jgi:hypothetical protein
MRKHIRLRKMLFAAAPAFVVAFGCMTTGAMASPSAHSENSQLSRRAGHFAARHGRHVVRREAMPAFGRNDAPAYGAIPSTVFTHHRPGYVYEPGYIYLPKQGIVDEACNLPTSTCPNDMRDVQ